MKILLLVFISAFWLKSFAQIYEDACFSNVDSENQRWENPDKMYEQYYVNLYFHIIRDQNGDGGAPESRVNEIMNHLNEAFSPHYIYFTNNDPVDYIDNDFLFNRQWSGGINVTTNNHIDGIDIYLYPETNSCSGANAFCSGSVGTQIVFMGTLRSTGIKLSEFAAPHEMGHMLGLPHTFEESFGTEAISGNNCLTTGDRFCDTPASPNRLIHLPCAGGAVAGGLNFEVSPYPECQWLNPYYEPGTGLRYKPDSTNFMDYSHPSCQSTFTTEQVKAMRAKMEKSNIIDDVVCSRIWGDYSYQGTYNKTLYTVNFVSSQNVDVDVYALQGSSFDWERSSGTATWVSYNNGREMSLHLDPGTSSSFTVSYENPCELGGRYLTFIHSSGWYSVYSNPTVDCVDIRSIDEYEVDYYDDKGKLKKLKIDPKIKKYKLLDDSGNVIKSKTYTFKKKNDRICLGELQNGIYYLILNEGDIEMYTEKIVKI